MVFFQTQYLYLRSKLYWVLWTQLLIINTMEWNIPMEWSVLNDRPRCQLCFICDINKFLAVVFDGPLRLGWYCSIVVDHVEKLVQTQNIRRTQNITSSHANYHNWRKISQSKRKMSQSKTSQKLFRKMSQIFASNDGKNHMTLNCAKITLIKGKVPPV